MEPQVGMFFEHTQWLDSRLPVAEAKKSRHLVFKVTRIAQGVVYFRPCYQHGERIDLGTPSYCPIAQFGRWAKREISPDEVLVKEQVS